MYIYTEITPTTTRDQGAITSTVRRLLNIDGSFFFFSPTNSVRLLTIERWKRRPVASIIQKSVCEQLFPGSLDRDHTETDDTMIDVISPSHALCWDQGSLQ